MALSIKELIQKNRSAHKQHFYIESVYLSYNLIGKVLRQILMEEKILNKGGKAKLSAYIKTVKSHYTASPAFRRKMKKSVFKTINEFSVDFKTVNKELKYQYPELKLKATSQKGINALVLLHTSVVKLKSNKRN
ncbi:MAG TPA: hypothetical protein VN026_15630 [Bacteroidia bacterium]|jgi:hypothetical protein|nr:hypothetical protein [Bacteroidia bacterium]